MTDTSDAEIDALHTVPPRFLIRKYGAFYRPNEQGYTGSAIQAGRYALDQAEKITHPNGPDGPRDGMSFIHEDDLQDDDWKAFSALRAERDAAYARGAHDAADRLFECSVWCDSQARTDDGWRNGVADARKHGMAAIRALADAPPAPVVRVKPLFFIERRNNMWDAQFGYEVGWNGIGNWFRVKQHGRVVCKKISGFDRAEEWANTHHAARILAALLPQDGRG